MNFKKNILVVYSAAFVRELNALPAKVQQKAIKAENIFKENPFHPSLRLHKLKGKLSGNWSLSINSWTRIIFRPQENGDVLFLSIGTHAIYN